MTASHGFIDLDVPGDEPGISDGGSPAGPRVGRKAASYLIAVFVLGVVIGGAAGAELWASRDERARAGTVALVAMPGSFGSASGSEGGRTVLPNAQLVLVNAGPAPITVRVEGAQRPGALVRDTGQSRLMRPGGTAWIDVQVTFDCATAFAPEPLPVSFSVETADHRVRRTSYPIALRGSPWQQVCERPPVRQ
ncbi:hypothetical protein [Micromonospora rubida]